MKKNNTIREICRELLAAGSVLIFPHDYMDGDALGSSIALCRTLREKGKEAHILIDMKIPSYLEFLDDGSCTTDHDILKKPDICVCVDCADAERFSLRREKFFDGKNTMCIDHHKTAGYMADFNYIDDGAAAAAEIIYDVILAMGGPIDKLAGEAIYAAIVTDTGNFQYANTGIKSHLVTVDLFNLGIDHGYVSMMLYQNGRVEKIYLYGKIINTIKMIAEGNAVIAHVTQEMLKETGALMEDTEGVSEALRAVGAVKLVILAKEIKENETKLSMRSKSWVDAAFISMRHNGGGHMGAAGCTIKKPIAEAMKIIERDVEKYFAENDPAGEK